MWIILSRGFWKEIVLERVQDAIERHGKSEHRVQQVCDEQ